MGETRQDEAALIAFDKVDLTLGGRLILTGIELSVRKGEFLSVVGPSGCGKTSLLKLAAGLLMPSSGEVTYRGQADHGSAAGHRGRVPGLRQGVAPVAHGRGQYLRSHSRPSNVPNDRARDANR